MRSAVKNMSVAVLGLLMAFGTIVPCAWAVQPSPIDEATQLRDELERVLPQLEEKGGGAKTRATLAVMNDFFPWILKDVSLGFTNRAEREIRELVKIGTNELERLRRVAGGLESDDPVPQYVTSPVTPSRMQTVATRRWPDGRTERGNVFFTGFGHFTQIQKDLAKMGPLGNNILQMEIGPSSVLPAENRVNVHALDRFLETARRAAQENVQICLLLSPHYFPDWAKAKWPHLKDCAGTRIGYCVYDPHAREVLEKYLRTVVPIVRGNPALHSLCLSNESEDSTYGKCRVLKERWPEWLRSRYGTVGKMNATWRTSYADFASVPIPARADGTAPAPHLVDFIRFEREMYAGFHRWMAGIIHEIAPEIPVHAKIMCENELWTTPTLYSVDIEDFAELSDYNGNDASIWPLKPERNSKWGYSTTEWPLCEIAFDHQRSAAEKPIFNTENHLIRDREKGDIPGSFVYSALWQQAVHGQTLTTLWAWERAYDNGKSDFNGLILERPDCLNAWAHCALDLNRLADRLAPIQNQEPTVLLLYSLSSRAWKEGIDESYGCYRALTGLGQSIGVVVEKTLAEYARTGKRVRPLKDARAIVLPAVGHLPDEARQGLKRLAAEGVRVIAYAKKPLFDEYGNARADDGFTFIEKREEGGWSQLFADVSKMAKDWDLPDLPRARDVHSENGVEGVESHGYRQDGKSYLTIVNHSPETVRVRIEKPGVDLITGGKVDSAFDLVPLRPVFIRY